MGSKNRSAARFRICSGHRSDSRSGGSGGWKAAGTNEERKRRAGVHFPGRHLLLASCRSGTRFSGGARRASSSLVPRLAPRGFPGRQGWRGGERQGWRVSAVRKGGGCAGCEKGHGRGRVTFPPLGSVLTSHRSDSRFSGDGGAGAGCKKARAQGMGGGVRWRAHGVAGQEKTAVCAGERTGRRGGHPPPTSIGLPVQRGEAGRGKGEVRADPAECNSPRTVRAGRFALDPGGYLSSRAVSSQVLSAYEGLTAVFGMGTGGTPQLNHRKLPVP